MKPLCVISCPIDTFSGYGARSRDFIKALLELKDKEWDIKIMPQRWGDCPWGYLDENDPLKKLYANSSQLKNRQPEIWIQITIPCEFQPVGKYNIGITAGLEMTACPPQWLEGMNRMDMNIVPSNFVKGVMTDITFDINDEQTNQKQGELKNEKPIEVLFEGTDTNIFKRTNEFSKEFVDEMKNVDDTFNFLYVGHWLQCGLGKDRKDTGMLVKVFLETFKNMKKKPGLIMKTGGAGFSVLDREDILKKINAVKKSIDGDLPNIYFLHGDFTDEEMNELYNHPKVKAHVTFTHGEGFGRPLLEATISQKPVIAPNWSGHLDFLPKNLAILLGGSLLKVEKGSVPDDFLIEGSSWFGVNYQEASHVMKSVYTSYRKYTLNAKKLGIGNKSKFSLDAMTRELGKILDKYVPEFPEEVKLNLPKLKKVGSTDKQPKIKLPKLKKV